MKRARLASLLVGAAAFCGAAVLWSTLRDRTPVLTRPAFEEAFERWRREGIADYDLELSVEGDRSVSERYQLEVRGGAVRRFRMNGQDLPPGGPGAHYTVPGLLEVIDQELRMAAAPLDGGPAAAGAPRRPVLRAEFDPRNGLPRVFKRLAPQGQSRIIRVERFAPGGA